MVVDDSRINHDTGNNIETLVSMLHVDQLKFSAAQLFHFAVDAPKLVQCRCGPCWFRRCVIDSLEKTRRVFQVFRWKITGGKTLQQFPFRIVVVGCSYWCSCSFLHLWSFQCHGPPGYQDPTTGTGTGTPRRLASSSWCVLGRLRTTNKSSRCRLGVTRPQLLAYSLANTAKTRRKELLCASNEFRKLICELRGPKGRVRANQP